MAKTVSWSRFAVTLLAPLYLSAPVI